MFAFLWSDGIPAVHFRLFAMNAPSANGSPPSEKRLSNTPHISVLDGLRFVSPKMTRKANTVGPGRLLARWPMFSRLGAAAMFLLDVSQSRKMMHLVVQY